jgi:hypothetical protein
MLADQQQQAAATIEIAAVEARVRRVRMDRVLFFRVGRDENSPSVQ